MIRKYFKLKSYFVENNIKQKDVAKALNITRSTLSKKINRIQESDFTLDECRQICLIYNLNPDIFFLN